MLPLEHSAILLTCIKRLSILKTIFGLFESGRFTQVLLYVYFCYSGRWYPGEMSKYWLQEFIPEPLPFSLVWLFIVPLACFIAHSVSDHKYR